MNLKKQVKVLTVKRRYKARSRMTEVEGYWMEP